jgi:glycosyltransferase involved in cell wall biosynthesis
MGIKQVKIAVVFPKDSEALFNRNSLRTFGGANLQLFMIARELSNHAGITAYSFIPEYPAIDFRDADKFNLVTTFRESDSFPLKVIKYHRTIRKLNPDVIIQRGLTLESCLFAAYCALFQIKYIFMLAHDIESEGRYQTSGRRCPLFGLLLRFSYLLVAQNELQRERVLSRRGAPRIEIIKKGIVFPKARASGKKLYDCIWVARCDKWKDPESFIKLAESLPGKKFCMVCFPAPGGDDYYDSIRRHAESLDNMDFFSFIPNDRLQELYARSRLFVLTSTMEGDWPMTVLEAATHGLPIVSLNLNYSALINEYQGGIFCSGSLSTMMSALSGALKRKKALSSMSKNVGTYVTDYHDIAANVKRLIMLSSS